MGKKKKRKIELETIAKLESGICPECGKPIKWGEVLPVELLDLIPDKKHLGAGWWQLPNIESKRREL